MSFQFKLFTGDEISIFFVFSSEMILSKVSSETEIFLKCFRISLFFFNSLSDVQIPDLLSKEQLVLKSIIINEIKFH